MCILCMFCSLIVDDLYLFTIPQTGIRGQTEHRVLFDTGPHSAIFLDNAKRLEIPFEKIETIVLSHWHVDHSGGMLAAVAKCIQARKDLKNGPDKKPGKRKVPSPLADKLTGEKDPTCSC